MNQNTYKYLGAAAGLGLMYIGYKRYFSKDLVRHDVYHHNKNDLKTTSPQIESSTSNRGTTTNTR